MKTFQLDFRTEVDRPLTEVFDFFSQAENLATLTPPEVGFEMLTPGPIIMAVGTRIEYRIRLNGIPFRWISEISVWEPGVMFTDVQLAGPYHTWRHEHRFSTDGDRTIVEDVIAYSLPVPLVDGLVNGLFVEPRIRKIFAHRAEKIKEVFPALTTRT